MSRAGCSAGARPCPERLQGSRVGGGHSPCTLGGGPRCHHTHRVATSTPSARVGRAPPTLTSHPAGGRVQHSRDPPAATAMTRAVDWAHVRLYAPRGTNRKMNSAVEEKTNDSDRTKSEKKEQKQQQTIAEEYRGSTDTARHNQCKSGCTRCHHPAHMHVTRRDPQPHVHPGTHTRYSARRHGTRRCAGAQQQGARRAFFTAGTTLPSKRQRHPRARQPIPRPRPLKQSASRTSHSHARPRQSAYGVGTRPASPT